SRLRLFRIAASSKRARQFLGPTMKNVITTRRGRSRAGGAGVSEAEVQLSRRRFLKTAFQAGALLSAPQVVSAAVLGKDGGIAPSERIRMGGIGIGNRGTYDLGCFLQEPDVRFVAICDVKAARREAVKRRADEKYGNQECAMF